MRVAALFALACLGALPLGAQQIARPITVRVRVVDSTNRPVENVSVSLVRGLNQTLVSGITDRNGLRTLRINERPDEFEVIARRVGYAPANKVFALEQRDTLSVELTLRRLPARLDTVRVTAEQSIKRQRLTVDADAIATFDRPLIDATDIINKMRPDMVYGLGGRDVCPAAQYVWVNGVRIEDPPINGVMEAKHDAGKQFSNTSVLVNRTIEQSPPAPKTAAAGPTALRNGPHTAYTQLGTDVLSILGSIKPEHIAFIEMHDCKDVSIDKKGGSAALFVILKDGVTFEPGIGSRVGSSRLADSLLKRIMLPGKVAALPKPAAPAPEPAPLEPFRMRILGLFNAESGSPIDSAEVVDLGSGVIARTTETGTVALAFLPLGESRIALRKNGFKTDTVDVRISPADTLPLTVLLVPLPH